MEFCKYFFLGIIDFCRLVLDSIFLGCVVRFEDSFHVTIAKSSEVLESVSNEGDDMSQLSFLKLY